MKHLERWTARQSQDEKAWGICVEGTERKPVWIIHPTKELDDQDAALIMAAHNAAVEKRPERMIEVNSITNTRLEPIIQIVLGPEVAQFKLPEAQQLAQQFLEVIEAAQSDALLCRFIRDYIYHGKDDDQSKHAIGHMLTMFRDFRKSFTAPEVQAGGEQ